MVAPQERIEHRAIRRAVGGAAAILLLLGLYWAESPSELFAYLLVVASSLVPTALWILLGRIGVPVFPAVSALHILYFAFPIVRGRDDLVEYSYESVLRAAATVSFYVLVAGFVAHLILRGTRIGAPRRGGLLSDSQMVTLVFLGLGVGILFLGGSAAGRLWWLGGYFGLVRAVALTALLVACYFLGVARGRGVLLGRNWFLAASGLILAIFVSWSSLYLVGGLMFLLAAAVGYVTTRGRIPWLVGGVVIILVSILHAGKEEMRHRYWRQEASTSADVSLLQLPALAVEWFRTGLETIGSESGGRSALDRASLMQVLLRVQYLTPAHIDYARGETYALLPGMLVPRFLAPNKVKSQAGTDLLNVRYGIQSIESTETTTVGWGLIAEGYANFGLLGVAGIALFVGAACGTMARWSARGSTVSVSTLLAVALMIAMINLEQDFAALVTSFLQSVAAVFAFVAVLRLFPRRRGSDGRQEVELPLLSGQGQAADFRMRQ